MTSAQTFHVLFPHAGTIEQSPFAAMIETLVWGLRELGHAATFGFGEWRHDATQIVLCPHLLDAATLGRLPADTILYNLDQITPASPIPPSRLWEFRHWRTWDFSARNAAIWNSLGIKAALVPVGWYPGLDRIPGNDSPDLDVLFYGLQNPRRKALIERVAALGLRVGVCSDVFGRELDVLIARSKIVLNIHYYPAHLLETMRLCYLLANGRAVVSERSAHTNVPEIYADAIHWAAYENLADACAAVAADADRRAALGLAGRAAMRQLAIAPLLAAALASDATAKAAA